MYVYHNNFLKIFLFTYLFIEIYLFIIIYNIYIDNNTKNIFLDYYIQII